jgi:hypothetical protein
MRTLTRFGTLLVPAGIALLFVPGTALYGVLLLAAGLAASTVTLGLLLKSTGGPGWRVLTACVLLAGICTGAIAVSIAGMVERRTDAYVWRHGTDVELLRPELGAGAGGGTGLCNRAGSNWHCALDWTAGETTVSGQATIDRREFDGRSATIPARALGSHAVSVGAHPRSTGNQLVLGAVPFWVAPGAAAVEIAAWVVALRIFSRRTGIGIFRARPPAAG